MKTQSIICIVFVLLSFISCEDDESGQIHDGGTLKGTIGIYEGNCMPGPDVPACNPSPISTTVAITQPSESFNIDLLVDSVISSNDGTFEIMLEEGNYSIFLRDGNEFICDGWTHQDESYCTLVTIKKDSITTITANIDHASW